MLTSKLQRLTWPDTIGVGWVSLFVFLYSYVGKEYMNKDINLELTTNWDSLRIMFETLYENKLISFDMLINCLVLGRMKLNLPVADIGIISVKK